MAYTNRMVLEILSLPGNVGLARVAVATFASQIEFTWAEIEEIKVAVSEAVTNAVLHAYPEEAGNVVITATLDSSVLQVRVDDQGRGIKDIELARQPSFSTDPERMGLGFAFMESLMDGLEVVSAPGRGTSVRMMKRAGQKK